jgi:hypothetical protein
MFLCGDLSGDLTPFGEKAKDAVVDVIDLASEVVELVGLIVG